MHGITTQTSPEVSLNSTLIHGEFALLEQSLVFTCVTRNGTILVWQSEYTGNRHIQIYNVGPRDNVTNIGNPSTYATRVSVTEENGVIVIVSQLHITASDQFPTASVTCWIGEQAGSQETISFKSVTTGTCISKFVKLIMIIIVIIMNAVTIKFYTSIPLVLLLLQC